MKLRHLIICFAVMYACAPSALAAGEDAPVTNPQVGHYEQNLVWAAIDGDRISRQEQQTLKDHIKQFSDDVEARAKLLGSYFVHNCEPEVGAERLPYVLWMIDNKPTFGFTGMPYCSVNGVADKKGFEEGERHWLRQVALHPDNLAIIVNAGHFCELYDQPVTEALYRKAITLDANTSQRYLDLAQQLLFQKNCMNRSKEIISFLETADCKSTDDASHLMALLPLCTTACAAGEYDKAESAATSALAFAPKVSFLNGEAVHDCNDVLGRVALKKGDKKQADQYLIAAGKAEKSSMLEGPGPSMKLAQALLEAGERDAVIAYLQECSSFWQPQTINGWIEEIRAGKKPKLNCLDR